VSGTAAVVLAAGLGRRLRPLTLVRPKALCPVGNVPLLDRALERLAALGLATPDSVAVNACYLAEQVIDAVGDRAHLSVEPDEPLGTAGGLGNLKPWLDGRAALVYNSDAYLDGADLAPLLDGWDGATVRMLTVPGPPAEFSGRRFAGLTLIPWSDIETLPTTLADLVRTTWRPAERDGRLELIDFAGTYLDTGTPRDYLAANLHAASDGALVSPDATVTVPVTAGVVGAGATVHGDVVRGVVWPGGFVAAGECLVDAVRVGRTLTVKTTRAGREHEASSEPPGSKNGNRSRA
jgi:N-acetyl-alpha-D-muramate 1-phosphate uridylyltransferase